MKVELGVGECEVVLKSLSKALDKESIRIDGIGPASITEVSYQVEPSAVSSIHPVPCVPHTQPLTPPQEVPVTVEEDQAATASAEVVELEQRLSDLVSHVKTVEQRLARLTAQSALLRDFSSNLMSAGEHSGTATLTDRQTVGQGGSLPVCLCVCVSETLPFPLPLLGRWDVWLSGDV